MTRFTPAVNGGILSLRKMAGDDGTDSLQSARGDGTIQIVTVDKTPLFAEFERNLDTGEAATLAYASETDADLVLLDERDA